MKKLVLLLAAVVVAAVAWGVLRKTRPPEVAFVRVQRERLVSSLPTNGKVESIEWQAVRSESAGTVTRVLVHEGEAVAQGAILAEVSDPSVAADLQSAEARMNEVQAALDALSRGGRPAELADIENHLARARFDLAREQKEQAVLERLQQKQAATAMEVQAAADKARQSEIEIHGLETRRQALVASTDLDAARARLRDAESALVLARQRQNATFPRAPISGQIYELAVRRGAYLNPGDLVANVGRLDRVRVRVYVDEPLLGRVAKSQPVTITWEGHAGQTWQGRVEGMPVAIQTLGSRQVGEVLCTVENPGRELLPGANVDAEIRTGVVEDALALPKEALRHDPAGDWVFRIRDGILERRAVHTGIGTISVVQVVDGLSAGDAVALPGDAALYPGERVTGVVRE